MRFSEAWLREWVSPPLETQALCDQLSMSGLEVDAIEPAAPAFTGVVVGHVAQIAPHPDADKLRVCQVDIGAGEPQQIICGAANVAEGMRVPVATIGAVLPGDFKIKKAKLRGVPSHGMICSASELGLAESSDGILPLPARAPIGEDLRDYLQLDDACIELDLTPDRADCLSVAGVAREVGVLNRVAVERPEITPVSATIEDVFPVEVQAPDACPRYLCRIIRDVDTTAETPLWMRERLRRSGLRPLSIAVDVTNYVLLELGQPLHAFDLSRLSGGIQVRMAHEGESLALLNGEEIRLRDDSLVIADAQGPVALAGIMGGQATAVTTQSIQGHRSVLNPSKESAGQGDPASMQSEAAAETGEATHDLLLESAFFAPEAISGKARSYGLHTDSSHRFERGVDPQLQALALERATALILSIAGGQPGPVVEVLDESRLPQIPRILLRRARIPQVLGVSLEDPVIVEILERLGMGLMPAEGEQAGWWVTPPSARFDIRLEVDLIAEIGRVHGYDRLPVSYASSAATTKAPREMALDLPRLRQALVDRGYHEAITYSFTSLEQQLAIHPGPAPLMLANPLSAELAAMRTSLWPGLLSAARQNLARQQSRVRLFEVGQRFWPASELLTRHDSTTQDLAQHGPAEESLAQQEMIAGLCVGSLEVEQWSTASRSVDFFDLKADVEALFRLSGLSNIAFVAAEHPALHPGQSARIERDGESVGWLGTLHPSLAASLDLPDELQLFELETRALGNGPKPSFQSLSRYPSIRRDIALVLDAKISFAQVRSCIRDAAGELLQDLLIFDVYTGEHVDSGRKSIALGLILQAVSKTLTDDDVDGLIQGVLGRLEAELGAVLRR